MDFEANLIVLWIGLRYITTKKNQFV